MRNWLVRDRDADVPGWLGAAYCAVLALGLAALFHVAFAQLGRGWDWAPVWAYRQKFWAGWWVTIGLSAAALGLSLVIGVLAALARRSRLLPLHFGGVFYVELIRGTPLLVQILLFFYVLANAARLDNRYVAGVAILAVFAGAYISEIVRAGIEGVPRSQLDAAKAIGFTPLQTYRFVILPQALRRMLPPLAGQFVSLIKDSSLLSVIAVNELTLNAEEVNAYTYGGLECYIPLAAGYLVLTLPLSAATRWLERRYRYEH